jgi:hypothetical protein
LTAFFVDTSFLIAIAISDDAWHPQAVAWEEGIAGKLLTTDYVLLEFVDALSSPRVRDLATVTVGTLRNEPHIQIIPASVSLMDEGLEFFARHIDKHWTLTDCISFVVMRREGIRDALTSDRHFEQAGFRALLRHSPPELEK